MAWVQLASASTAQSGVRTFRPDDGAGAGGLSPAMGELEGRSQVREPAEVNALVNREMLSCRWGLPTIGRLATRRTPSLQKPYSAGVWWARQV